MEKTAAEVLAAAVARDPAISVSPAIIARADPPENIVAAINPPTKIDESIVLSLATVFDCWGSGFLMFISL